MTELAGDLDWPVAIDRGLKTVQKYLKTEQFIPNKGMSFTMYEIEGENQILRMMTWIPDVDQISIYPKPPVKQLFAPERCQTMTEEEFSGLWIEGENRKKSG